jgi:inorganic pyrophosphatase
MLDRGARDYKVLAVPAKDPLFGHYKDIGDVPPHFLREVFHFFEVYKDLEGQHVEPLGWENAASAKREIKRAIKMYTELKKPHARRKS